MNDATFRECQRRVEKIVKYWKPVMGLADWHITITYHRDPTELMDSPMPGYECFMDNAASWEYKQALIRVNCQQVVDCPEDELTNAVLHEFAHCHVSEMRDWSPKDPKHEERVVCEFVDAVSRAFQLGMKHATKIGKQQYGTVVE